MSQAALINPAILTWSRERAGMSTEELARRLPAKPERVLAWESGVKKPTFKQAQHWASIAHVPFGFLFLREPPVEHLPLPDLRTIEGHLPEQPSLNLMDTVKDVLRKQEWYLEYLQDHQAERLPFVGRFTSNSPVRDVVADIRKTLNVDAHASRLNYDAYVRSLIQAAESLGILVMRSGVALGNTHRKLDVAEFRGFAISNVFAPVIFINSADAPAARLFTLMHEMAHIWIGSSGVSDGGKPGGRREEVLCNAVAGEFLVPEDLLRAHWDLQVHWQANLAPLSSRFHVSKLVIGRRARDLGLVPSEEYGAYYRQVLREFQEKDGGAGDFYATAKAKNSARLSRAVVAEALSGRMLLRDAGRLLGVQPAKIRNYASRVME